MKIKKIFLTLGIVLVLVNLMSMCFSTVYADKLDDLINSNIKDVTKGSTGGMGIGEAINTIVGLIQFAGTGISVIMVTILGVKYMMSSANDRADIKKQAIPVVVGAIILFASVNIAGIIADLGYGFNG